MEALKKNERTKGNAWSNRSAGGGSRIHTHRKVNWISNFGYFNWI